MYPDSPLPRPALSAAACVPPSERTMTRTLSARTLARSLFARGARPSQARLGILALEDRIVPAMQDVSGLRFQVPGQYNASLISGGVTYQSSESIAVGLVPQGGAAFVPLFQLADGGSINAISSNPAASTFTWQDRVNAVTSGAALTLFSKSSETQLIADTLPTATTAVPHKGGQPASVGPFSLAPTAFRVRSANQLGVGGDLGVTDFGKFTLPAGPDKFVTAPADPGVSFSAATIEGGFRLGANPSFGVAGLTFQPQPNPSLPDVGGYARITQGTNRVEVAGQANFTLAGNPVSVTIGQYDPAVPAKFVPGAAFEGGALKSLDVAVTSTVKLGGLTFSTDSLRGTYDAAVPKFTLSGKTSFDLKGSSVGVTFGGAATPGLVVVGGKVTSADFAVNADIKLGGLTFAAKDLRAAYTDADETYTLKGTATFGLENGDAAVAATFGGATTPGLVLAKGVVKSADFTVDSKITVGGLTFTSQGLRATYADGDPGTYTLAGKASFALAGNTVAVTAGSATTPGLVITGGSVRSFDFTVDSKIAVGGLTFTSQGLRAVYAAADRKYTLTGMATAAVAGVGTVGVTFGDTKSAGLVIQDGSLASLDVTVNSDITVSAVKLTTTGLVLTYTAATGLFTLTGNATATVDKLGTLNVGFGFAGKPGLVIQNGSLVNLDLTLNSDITVSAVKITTTGLGLSYTAATGLFTLTGNATATVDKLGTLNVTFGSPGKAGLVIANGSLVSLDLTLNSDITVSAVKITTTGLGLSYTAATALFTLTGAATATVDKLGTVAVTFGFAGKPGLVIQNGALSLLDLTLNSDITVSAVKITTTGLELTYTAATGLFTLTGAATATVNNLGTLNLTFGSAGKPGLVVNNGALDSLALTLTSDFSVSGVKIAATGLALTYTANDGLFTLAGAAGATVAGLGNFSLTFGSAGKPGLVIKDGALVSLNTTLASGITVSGVTIATTGLEFTYTAATSLFTLAGAAKATIAQLGTVDLIFGNGGRPGLVIANGALVSLDLTLDSDITVSAVKLTTKGLGLTYTAAASQFTLTGAATATVDKLGTVGVTFGFQGKPGLVIQNGSLIFLDLTLNADITVSAVRITTTGLELTYTAATSQFTLAGTARATVDKLGTVGLTFGFQGKPGLVIQNGSLVSLDVTLTSDVTVSRVRITTAGLELSYVAATDQFTLTGTTVLTVPQFGNVSATFGFDNKPGLVIRDGSLVSLDLRLNSNITFLKYTFEVENLDFSYVAATGTFTVRGRASVDLLLGSFAIQLGDGVGGQGIVITNGVVTSIDATVSGEVQAAFVSLGKVSLQFKYDGAKRQFDLTGRVEAIVKIKLPFPASLLGSGPSINLGSVQVDVRVISGDNMNSFTQIEGTSRSGSRYLLKITFSGEVTSEGLASAATAAVGGAVADAAKAIGNTVASGARAVFSFGRKLFGGRDNDIAGAIVFYDPNFSGVRDPSNPSAVTAGDGTFTLDVPAGGGGQLVLVGGTNVGTNLPNKLVLTAPAGATKVSPVSTLIQAIRAAQSGLSQVDATAYVEVALGIPTSVDPLNDNLIEEALGGVDNAVLAFDADVQVASLANGIAALIGPSVADGSAVFAELAAMIVTAGAPVDLTDPAVVERLIQGTADRLGVTLDPALVSGGATVLAGINARIKAIPETGGSGYLTHLDQIQIAAGTGAIPMLAAAAAGTMDIAAVVAAQTGDAFAAEAAGERVGVLAAPASNASPLYAVGTGVGGGPRVRVYDRQTNALVADFFAFDPAFRGGVNVAVGDVTGDGVPDVVVAAGDGGHARVIVIDGTKLNNVVADGQIDPAALVASFFAFNVEFTGGATVALARLGSGPGLDLVVGAGAGGGPRVRTFHWSPGAVGGVAQLPGRIGDFFALDPAFTGGVNVAAADLDGLGRDDVIVGAGVGGGPVVAVYLPDGTLRDMFMAYDPSSRGGVSVAGGYLDGTSTAQLVTASGPGGPAVVNVYQGAATTLERSVPVFGPDFTGGASVAVGPTADGQVRVIVGAGPGGGPRVGVLAADGLQGVDDFFGFDPTFRGGVLVG